MLSFQTCYSKFLMKNMLKGFLSIFWQKAKENIILVLSFSGFLKMFWVFMKDTFLKRWILSPFPSFELFIPFFIFRWFWPTKLRKYYVIYLFTFFKSLACLALQTETIVKKITQPKLPKMKNEVTKICNEPGNCAQKS